MPVSSTYHTVFTKTAFAFCRFFCENVAFVRFLESNFSGTGYFETLLGARVGFNLWHYNKFDFYTLLASQTDGNLWSLVGKLAVLFKVYQLTGCKSKGKTGDCQIS